MAASEVKLMGQPKTIVHGTFTVFMHDASAGMSNSGISTLSALALNWETF